MPSHVSVRIFAKHHKVLQVLPKPSCRPPASPHGRRRQPRLRAKHWEKASDQRLLRVRRLLPQMQRPKHAAAKGHGIKSSSTNRLPHALVHPTGGLQQPNGRPRRAPPSQHPLQLVNNPPRHRARPEAVLAPLARLLRGGPALLRTCPPARAGPALADVMSPCPRDPVDRKAPKHLLALILPWQCPQVPHHSLKVLPRLCCLLALPATENRTNTKQGISRVRLSRLRLQPKVPLPPQLEGSRPPYC